MSDTTLFDAAADYILKFSKFIVVSHTNPDADAFGSSCGMALGLRMLGVDVQILNEKGSPERYLHIPGVKEVISKAPEVDQNTLICVCDCGASDRVGDSLIPWVKSAPEVLNIDHHFKNEMFGKVNLVLDKGSSTSEIITKLLLLLEKRSGKTLIDSENAYALFAGIMADTGSFRYESTSSTTFEAAEELMKRGARPHQIGMELFSNVSLPAIKLQAEALLNVTLLNDGRFAEVITPQVLIKKHGAEIEDSDSLAEKARDIKGVVISALYKEDKDLWRVSLRSKSPNFDVSEIARSFGGGGHKVAAAFRSKKGFEFVQAEVRKQVKEILK